MTLRRLAAVAMILAIGVALGRTAGSAAEDEDESKAKLLSVECAQAKLKLAQMNLARAQELNQKVPGTLIGGMMEQFVKEVEMARVELDLAKKSPRADTYLTCLERVKLDLRSAEQRAKVGLETHEKAPTVVTKGDVERMRLFANVANLQLRRGQALADASASDKLEWQLEVLADDLERVRIYTYLLGQNRVGQFFPGGL
ncbi:MAG: hypothetical protein WD063_00910 [Pirellulales bacterium]